MKLSQPSQGVYGSIHIFLTFAASTMWVAWTFSGYDPLINGSFGNARLAASLLFKSSEGRTL